VLSNVTLVRVSSPSSVIDNEPEAGRLRASSRTPQYLIKAMLGCAMAVAEAMGVKFRRNEVVGV
jgi:hypothetical protein